MNVPENNLGEMNVLCKFCRAKHFKGEELSKNTFKHCCNRGRNKIVIRNTYPEYLKGKLTNSNSYKYENFKKYIRNYNNAIAFASFGAKYDNLSGKGPDVIRVFGQIYHQTSNLYSSNNTSISYGQLYVYDSEEAATIQMNHIANEKCDKKIMTELNQLMRDINPFAKHFHMLHEKYTSELRRCSILNINVSDYFLIIHSDGTQDIRRYNEPASNEIAFVFESSNGDPPSKRDICIYPKSKNNYDQVMIDDINPNIDPMTYPIFYPYGEAGWKPNLLIPNYINDEIHKITLLKWKTSQLSLRDNEFNPLIYSGKLFQQWIIDSYLHVESKNLNYCRFNQAKLKVETYKALTDYLQNFDNEDSTNIGRKVILPSSFQGSPRHLRERYMDAMAIVSKYGRPDIFLTFTCNSLWKEIVNNLEPHQSSYDRPDIVSRVFKLKLKSLINDITKLKIFGEVVGFMYTVEFQKRGLPHAHILIILKGEDKIRESDKVNKLISAEIPDPIEEPDLFKIVTKFMVHGPCGVLNPNSPCMKTGECSKMFPKDFINYTTISNCTYPRYRRRTGSSVIINDKPIDNRWIVPYNRFLLLKYNCHINVEICSSVKSIKYIIKYIHKGYDCATVELNGSNGRNLRNCDEITSYINSRYISACEASYRLFEFSLGKLSHSIIRLMIHNENYQPIHYIEGQEANAVSKSETRFTTLTAWFQLNTYNHSANQYRYPDIPYHFVYNEKESKWEDRKRKKSNIISRMYSVSPKDTEKYYLRIILLHKVNGRSFEDLRTVDGIVYDTFQNAAIAMNLVETDEEYRACMQEASETLMPKQIRVLFAYILLYNNVNNPKELWKEFKEKMMEDYSATYNKTTSKYKALVDIQLVLINNLRTLQDFHLPLINEDCRLNEEEYDADFERSYFIKIINTLNESQKQIFDDITTIISDNDITNKCFFIDGPGGSGKTYLYNVFMSYYRGNNETVLPFATTGISSLLLKGGRTVHSGLKIPIPCYEEAVITMKNNSKEAIKIRNSKLIIIDEVSMLLRFSLVYINRLLQNIMSNTYPFGGKAIILGGDFRQTLPVVINGSRSMIVENCIFSDEIWCSFRKYRLSKNMRVLNNEKHKKWIERIGNGEICNSDNLFKELVEIPEDMISTDLIKDIYGTSINLCNIDDLANKSILTLTNSDADEINDRLLESIDGDVTYYYSVDKIISDDENEVSEYTDEYINSLRPSGTPTHVIKLKINSIIMLIRNLNHASGLCNGTRLIIKDLHKYFIDAVVLTGEKKGKRVYIPRVTLIPSDTSFPFKLQRKQFPIIPAYAITINKSQGQTFEKIGINLKSPVFTHGQLYTALSRCTTRENIKIFVENSTTQGKRESLNKTFAINIVYSEIYKKISTLFFIFLI